MYLGSEQKIDFLVSEEKIDFGFEELDLRWIHFVDKILGEIEVDEEDIMEEFGSDKVKVGLQM